MRIQEFITEAFTDPYPTEIEAVNNQRYQSDVVLNDGSNLQIAFELNDDDPDYGQNWGVEFFREGEQGVTGQKDAFSIFATVMDAIKQFIQIKGPEIISFSADKNYTGESRFKLYKRMVAKYADQLGYTPKIDDRGHYADFTLFKKNK